MKSKIGEFIVSPEFGELASKAIKEAVAEANKNGLKKAYFDRIEYDSKTILGYSTT